MLDSSSGASDDMINRIAAFGAVLFSASMLFGAGPHGAEYPSIGAGKAPGEVLEFVRALAEGAHSA